MQNVPTPRHHSDLGTGPAIAIVVQFILWVGCETCGTRTRTRTFILHPSSFIHKSTGPPVHRSTSAHLCTSKRVMSSKKSIASLARSRSISMCDISTGTKRGKTGPKATSSEPRISPAYSE
eukprot:scaffold1228_cov246-Pinguiococcus_pyrenoidosus.AAC.12